MSCDDSEYAEERAVSGSVLEPVVVVIPLPLVVVLSSELSLLSLLSLSESSDEPDESLDPDVVEEASELLLYTLEASSLSSSEEEEDDDDDDEGSSLSSSSSFSSAAEKSSPPFVMASMRAWRFFRSFSSLISSALASLICSRRCFSRSIRSLYSFSFFSANLKASSLTCPFLPPSRSRILASAAPRSSGGKDASWLSIRRSSASFCASASALAFFFFASAAPM